ncbi:MAG: Rieske (2Fe-2S) protein [Candidatus Latescibacteria bacterium]|jgi:nitrite reductase/ring-hydroxylating ferredoxin subunit|nr:Rieske (2Fe-2S) protein [Candidatus Latescibacterota bacterium]
MPRHIVANVDEIPPGERKVLEVDGRSIGVFNVDGEFYAIRNRCPHQGGPVCEGYLTGFLKARIPGEYTYTRQGEILRCPWHGWEFDVKTGQSWIDPKKVRTRSYPAHVSSASAVQSDPDLETGPYIAETYQVSIDSEFVIVEIP